MNDNELGLLIKHSKRVSPKIWIKLRMEFGTNLIKIININPTILKSIKGIGDKTITAIQTTVKEIQSGTLQSPSITIIEGKITRIMYVNV